MREKTRKHMHYYLLVGFIQIIGLVIILNLGGNKQLQLAYIVLISCMYVLWGVIHHKIHHDLHTKVVVEYILMGSLAIALMYFLLQ